MLWIKYNYATIWYGFHTNFEQISHCYRKYKGYSISNEQPFNNFIISYLYYTNKLMQKHNEHVFAIKLGPTFIFKAMDISP
jgi:hypothetical protein